MARGRIPIGEGRRLSRQYDVPVVVCFALHPGATEFTVMTYGATKKLCRYAASLGEQFARAIMDQRVVPVDVEPLHLPESPAILGPQGDAT